LITNTKFLAGLQFILILLVLLSVFYNFQVYKKLRLYKTEFEEVIHKISDKTPAKVERPRLKITSPLPGAMVTQNSISIVGQAETNCIVGIWENGQVVQVTIPQNGKFSFENIALHRHIHQFEIRCISDSGKMLSLEKFEIEYQSPTLQYLARDFTRGNTKYKQVALTFDGDYLDNVAGAILDMLQEKQVPATFFLTARFIERYQNTVNRIIAAGHQVANHTWHHPHLTMFEEKKQHILRPEVDRKLIHHELKKTANIFKDVTGEEMSPFWRAPFGEHNLQIRQWAAELGYRQIGWTRDARLKISLDTMDWVADKNSPLYRKPDDILENILTFADQSEQGVNGGIILMHLGTLRPDEFPHKIVGPLIDSLQTRGYKFVKIESMVF
jgi:peptidoglycan/xylan/chitin deacetylase (PgdA/CDA1 family)